MILNEEDTDNEKLKLGGVRLSGFVYVFQKGRKFVGPGSAIISETCAMGIYDSVMVGGGLLRGVL